MAIDGQLELFELQALAQPAFYPGRSWPAVAAVLANEAADLKADSEFAREVSLSAQRLAIPQPAAVVEARVYRAVARRCTELVDFGDHRQAAALLAGHKHAVEKWGRYPPGPD